MRSCIIFQIYKLSYLKLIKNLKLRIFAGDGFAASGESARSGFTLIELLVVISITAVISTAGITMFVKYRNSQNLKLSTTEVATAMRDANRRSVTQQDGKQWALRLSNTTSSQRYELWGGTSYASGTIAGTGSLRNNIQFGNPPASSTLDLMFSAITGALSGNQMVTLNDGSGDGLVGDIIANILGHITVRNDTGVAGYWHFDENASSTAYDASGNGNNGTLVGSPTWTSGSNCKAGSCLSFNGSNYVTMDDPSNGALDFGTGDFSVSGWFYLSSLPSAWKSIVSKGGSGTTGYGMEISNANQITCSIEGASGTNQHVYGSVPSVGSWHQAVCVFARNDKVYVYLDGVEVGSSVYSSGNTNSVSNDLKFNVGKYSSSGWDFVGNIDEVRVYNRALSADEVLSQYNDLK